MSDAFFRNLALSIIFILTAAYFLHEGDRALAVSMVGIVGALWLPNGMNGNQVK